MPPTEGQKEDIEEKQGIVPSHGISVDLSAANTSRPPNLRHVYDSGRLKAISKRMLTIALLQIVAHI